MLPQRKYTRLALSYYQYPCPPCSITIVIKERQTIFGLTNDARTRQALAVVSEVAKHGQIPVHVALFMPDHAHLCVEASPRMSIIEFVKEIKSRIAVELYRLEHIPSFWQRSFFDHFLRKEEKLSTIVRYILANPCRKNIVQYFWEYPYWYSNQYTLEQLKNTE